MTDDGERSLVRVAFPAGDPVRDGVALVTLDRPEARNALSFALLEDLDDVLAVLDDDESCRAIVITGAGERAFAAGADIRDLASSTRDQLRRDDPFAVIDRVGRLRTPVIAAVRGYALGGGCELAMACDIVVAGDDAVFGQPELSIGVIPGAGGTQRLARAVGRARAMDVVLSGRQLGADEAERIGLVSVVVPAAEVVERRSIEPRRSPRSPSRPCGPQRPPSTPRSGSRSTRGCGSSASGSRRCSTPTTTRRGWSPSSRSGRRSGGTASRVAEPSSGRGFLGHRGPHDDDIGLAVRPVVRERAGGIARGRCRSPRSPPP